MTLEEGGVEITALHNHLLYETPRVMYTHIGARGDATKLAQTIREALDKTKIPAVNARAPTQESNEIGRSNPGCSSCISGATTMP